ncbi:MAG: FtsW/RodA/SpoVE family cell cycle protein [Lachnospiraceae bacterium]|nr:FtsW/RodA/SpoVE family cell cycle protein [Lachnospiraceae bacterium]MBP3507142.1 FtsW/RodA/SpoVE family cell cycle protein [Lachnospiraceae bacterium]
MLKGYRLRDYNFKLIILVLVACIFGTVVIHSADSSYTTKQIIGLVGCFGVMIFVSLIDYHYLCKAWILIYILNIIMLLGLIPFGKTVNNAKRWYGIGNFMTIQPSEFTKIIMIICLAVLLTKLKDKLNTWKSLLLVAVFCGIPLVIVERQPDLSTTIDIFLILLAMIFTAGLSYKLIGIVTLILIPVSSVFFWYIQQPNQKLLDEYQLGRILAFRYPQDYALTTGYQQTNSVMAIGSGMLTGKGLDSSAVATVKDANLISEQQTDFIFSVVGEELGFIGCVFIIAIILLIVLQCVRIARKAEDMEGMLIATGVGTLICFQTFINIGVATQILPNTGLPLPFVSYGLSSLLSSCGGIGLVLNVGLHKKRY